MALIRSTWANAPVTVDGALNAAQWAGCGQMPIPGGFIMAKNDNQYLYLALDLTADTGNDAGVNDYFWLSFDLNADGVITPRRDTNYGIWPTLPIKLARQYFLGGGVWTTILPETSTSSVSRGFAASPNSATPHRIWEFRLDLNELEVDLSDLSRAPLLRFGLRTRSASPAFTNDSPANFFHNFAGLHELHLATRPSVYVSPGPIIGGVGLIPATQIGADGYATTVAPYYLVVKDVAFTGALNIIGNRTTLQNMYAAGARKYRVEHAYGSPAGAFTPIRQNWANYRWTGLAYTLESFGPDASNYYPLPVPADDYSIDDLLLQWNSDAPEFPNGLHHFRVRFFRPDNSEIVPVVPAGVPTVLSLMVDNSQPLVRINKIMRNGVTVQPCDIITLAAADTLTAELTVQDAQGNLSSYGFAASYGHNQGAGPFASAAYVPNPAKRWEGAAVINVPNFAAMIPQSCAYRFALNAYQKLTNGYSAYPGPTSDSVHVTIQRPVAPTLAMRATAHFPLGMDGDKENGTATVAGQ